MKQDLAFAGPVRVSLPASVASDIGSLKKAIGSVLDKLGCQACCSGHDIFIDLQRDFILRDGPRSAPISVSRHSHLAKSRGVRVGLQPEFAANIDNVFAAIDRIADLSGHTACATGCDMFLQMERNIVIDAKLGLEERVMSIG